MQKFTTFSDKIIPLDLDNVDTDMIIPAVHLTSTSRDGYRTGLFSNLKRMYADFIFNQPAYSNNTILVSKHNFGCGSSREHAVWALQEYGIKTVIAISFSDIFYNNAAKNGLLLIKLDENAVNFMLTESLANSNFSVMVDLAAQLVKCSEQKFSFSYDSFRRHCLINGIDDLDYLLTQNTKVEAYEKAHSIISR